jgi:hypothetical protein
MQKIKINRFHTVKYLGVDWDIVNKMTIVTQRRTEIHPSAHSLRTVIISALRTTVPSCRLTYPFLTTLSYTNQEPGQLSFH